MSVFEAALRLLSPFMPFLTEEIVARCVRRQSAGEVDCAYALSHWLRKEKLDEARLPAMSMLQNLVVEVRALRKEIGVEEKASDANRVAHRTGISEPWCRKIVQWLNDWRV